MGGGSGGMGGKRAGTGGKGYSRLEQHQHEKTRGTAARRESLQKAQAKQL
jgi:hypothetical protein